MARCAPIARTRSLIDDRTLSRYIELLLFPSSDEPDPAVVVHLEFHEAIDDAGANEDVTRAAALPDVHERLPHDGDEPSHTLADRDSLAISETKRASIPILRMRFTSARARCRVT